MVFKIFPTLMGLFVAIGVLRSSGLLDFVVQIISPITNFLGIPKEIMPFKSHKRINSYGIFFWIIEKKYSEISYLVFTLDKISLL